MADFQDYFGTPIAYDPTQDRLVSGATFTVHAIDDASLTTPLPVFEPGSGAAIAELRSSSVGVLPDFRVAGDPAQVLIKSGTFVTSLTSVYGAVLNAGLGPEQVQAAIQAGTDAANARDVATTAADDAIAAAAAAEAVGSTNDTIMAAVAADSGSQFAGQLSATNARQIAEAAVPRVARTLVVIGDSLTEQGGMLPGTPHRTVKSFWTWGLNLLGQRLDLVANLGVGGEVTGSIAPRIQSAIDLAPGWIHILAGTNDIGTSKTFAYSVANLTAMYDAVQAAGIRLVVGTIPPRDAMTVEARTAQAALNAWIRDEAERRPGVVLVDYEAALTDAATQGFPSTPSGVWTSDGTHFRAWGGFHSGRAFADAMRPHVAEGNVFPRIPGAVNLLGVAGGRFALGDGSTANGWGRNQYTTIPTTTNPARADNVYGTWMQQVVPAGDKVSIFINVNVGSSLAVGDVVEALVEYEVEALDAAAAANSTYFTMRTACYIGGTFPGANMNYDLWSTVGGENTPLAPRAGVFRTPPLTVASGTTLVQVLIEARGGGTYRFGRAVLRKV